MRIKAALIFSFLCSITFIQCSNSPEEYFGTAVLNVNMLFGFADNGFSRQLESPSSELPEGGGEPVPMTRKELWDQKTKFVEENFKKVESLKETGETKNMIDASIELYKFVIPVMKNEYTRLAEMYDNGVPAEQTDALTKEIHDKYYAKYVQLYNTLANAGKVYADKNNIKVNWGTYGR